MNFELTEEHLAVQQAARDFAQTELLPGVIERDNEQKFPAEQIKKDGRVGIHGYDGRPQVWWGWNGHHFLCVGDGGDFQD